MTTIAYKAGIIAADSQVTADDTKYLSADKITIVSRNVVLACAGDVNDILLLERWFREVDTNWYEALNTKPKVRKTLDAILLSEGRPYTIYRDGYPEPLGHPFIAVGSGWKFAMAGMHLGLSAPDAVKLASEFDVNTNDRIKYLDVTQLQGPGKATKKARRSTARAPAASPIQTQEAGTREANTQGTGTGE